MSPRARVRSRPSLGDALRIVLVFALFTLLWVFVTTWALERLIADPFLRARLSTIKSYLYVPLASTLLFWLVHTTLVLRGRESADSNRPFLPRSRLPLALLAGSCLMIIGLGYAAYRFQGARLQRDALAQLDYHASQKAQRVEGWLGERLGDAAATAQDPLLMEQLRSLGRKAQTAPDLYYRLYRRLLAVQAAHGYTAVSLLDADGRPLVVAGLDSLPPWETAAAGQAAAWTTPGFVWEVREEPGRGPRLQMVCVAALRDGRRALGTLVFRIDPGLLEDAGWAAGWPESSREILLLAQRGGEALFLTRARMLGRPVLGESMGRRDLVGVQALLVGDGLHWGVDYRRVPTVAVSRRLRAIPWTVVAKVDQDEYLLPIRRLAGIYGGLGAMFLIVAGTFLTAWYHQQRAELGRLRADSRSLDRQLELLSKYCNEIVLVLDDQGRVLEVNDVAVAAYQRSREELRSMHVLDLRAPELRGGLPQKVGTVQEAGAIRFQTVHLRRDGARFPVEVSSIAFDLGGRAFVRSIIRDITEQRAYEERIRTLNEDLEGRVRQRTDQLETALQEMESFSYSVAHDLRGPLRGIDGFSLALLDDYGARLDDQGRHFLQRIRSGAQRMGLLMDDLLDMARLGRRELERSEVDLSAQARQILDGLQRQAGGSRRVQTVVQEGLTVHADPRLMYLVLSQLLSNAWKFTGTRPDARIEFGGGPDPEGGSTFHVRDDGEGFDMIYAAKLFQPFQRLHDAAQFPGTGVGLTIAQRILQRHGGRAWAWAELDRGATFYFNLPA